MRSLRQYRFSAQFLILILTGIALAQCAHPVMPTGGPKDITPPQFIGSVPPNYSTNFMSKKIEIEFDEFLQLKDPAKEIFTSPPMVNKPEITVRGKKVIVELQEDLRKNSTYVINFGASIVDLTEGNPQKGFVYVFSTGSTIDSLIIAGKVLNAFDLTPVENVLLSVYNAQQEDTIPLDSMPLKIPPLSATRTFSDGSFYLTNLPGGRFFVFALEDLNNNFYYDLPGEKIGFLDSLVLPEYVKMVTDTVEEGDTTEISPSISSLPKNPVILYLFEELDSTQRLLSSSFENNGSLLFVFHLPVKNIEITPLNFPPTANWKIDEYNSDRDTLTIWPREADRDTFELRVKVDGAINDTVRLVRRSPGVPGGLFRRKSVSKQALKAKFNLAAGILGPGKDLQMTFVEPVKTYDFSGIMLFQDKDTLHPQIYFTDSLMRIITIHQEWQENKTYHLFIPDSVFTGLSGAENDSVSINIRTRPLSDYGTLIMNYVLPEGSPQCIIELLNDKESVVQKDNIKTNDKITYPYLKPGVYKIKLVFDRNGNGKWDTGNFRDMLLPELVMYYEKDITIRANWEVQDEWQISP